MINIGHYVITYIGTTWLSAQLQQNETFRAIVYSWARTLDDSLTASENYRQLLPHFGKSFLARRSTLGLGMGLEKLFQGTTHRIRAAMQKDRIDVLHAHFGRAGYYALPLIREWNIPLITSFYGYDVSEYPSRFPIWREYYRQLFDAGSYMLCLGQKMQRNIIELGCDPEKARIHHLGVNVNKIRYQPRKWENGEPLRILIASAFRERKGIPYALDALAKFRSEQPIEITIIGDAPDHPDGRREKKKIMAAIEQHQLKPIVRLLGQQPYGVLFEEAYKHHIFIGASITAGDGDMEGTPMVLVDMAASGMPIISTTHSDVPEIIKHGETGWLASERDSEGILEYLRWFASHPKELEMMTSAGRQYIETEFDQEKQNKRLGQLYLDSLEGRRQ